MELSFDFIVELYEFFLPYVGPGQLSLALIVFAIVGVLRASGKVNGNHARWALYTISFFSGGGFDHSNEREVAATIVIVFLAALYHRIWEWIKEFTSKRGEAGLSLASFVENISI